MSSGFAGVSPGNVRQHAEQSDDDGRTWRTVFDGLYMKTQWSPIPGRDVAHVDRPGSR